MVDVVISTFKDEINEIKDRSKKDVKEISKEEKLASKYCSVGNHYTEEKLYYCIHCHRTFCEEHGDETQGICNECIEKTAGQ